MSKRPERDLGNLLKIRTFIRIYLRSRLVSPGQLLRIVMGESAFLPVRWASCYRLNLRREQVNLKTTLIVG